MILNMNNIKVSVLLVSLSVCRKNIRNGFKKNYGKNGSKEILASYDDVKTELEQIAETMDIENEKQKHEIHLNIREMNMLHSFLSWYVPKLQDTLTAASKQANKPILSADKKQLDCLIDIKGQVSKLMEVAHA